MRIFFLLSGLFIVTHLFGQDKTIGLLLRPNIGQHIYMGNLPTPGISGGPLFCMDIGVLIKRELKAFDLETGLLVSAFGDKVFQTASFRNTSTHRFNYIGVPILLSKKIRKNMSVSIGLGNNILVRTKTHHTHYMPGSNDTIIYTHLKDLTKQGYSIYNPSIEGALGWEIPINPKISCYLLPTLSILLFNDYGYNFNFRSHYMKLGLTIKLVNIYSRQSDRPSNQVN
jgi:hypothetical protein